MAYCLHVDDDTDDLEIFQEIFLKLQTNMEYKSFDNSLEAFSFLKETEELPCVVIIDLNMPRMGGKELMMAIKDVPALSHISLVAFTTSISPIEQEFCLRYCDAFFTKPSSYTEYPTVIRSILPWCEKKSTKPQN